MINQSRYILSLSIFLLLSSCLSENAIFEEKNNNSINITSITQTPTSIDYTDNQIPVDEAYYEGIIVLTKYYTFLGHGLYEEAYYLLSESAKRPKSLYEYVETSQMFFKEVDIISIVPYHEYVRNQGGVIQNPDPPERKRFAVEIRAWGQGEMSGSRMSGDLQMLFIALVLEDGAWKIDTFGTAPLN